MILALPIISTIEDSFVSMFGSQLVFGMFVILFFVIAFMFAGVDFRIAGLVIMPVIIAMGELGWIPKPIVGLAWIILVGFGLYLIWNYLRER